MPKKTKNEISEDTSIGEAVSKHPETIPVFMKNGLHCIGCAVAAYESIGQGAQTHGINIDKLMKELNQAISKKKK